MNAADQYRPDMIPIGLSFNRLIIALNKVGIKGQFLEDEYGITTHNVYHIRRSKKEYQPRWDKAIKLWRAAVERLTNEEIETCIV